MNKPNESFQFNSAFDSAFLDELYEGDLSYVVVVFNGFLQEMPQCYDDMSRAFRDNDLAVLRSAAHKCKTIFAYVGLNTSAEQLRALEDACKTGDDPSTVSALYQDLSANRNKVEKLISEEIKRIEAFL